MSMIFIINSICLDGIYEVRSAPRITDIIAGIPNLSAIFF